MSASCGDATALSRPIWLVGILSPAGGAPFVLIKLSGVYGKAGQTGAGLTVLAKAVLSELA